MLALCEEARVYQFFGMRKDSARGRAEPLPASRSTAWGLAMALVAKCDRCSDLIEGEALRVLCRDLCEVCYRDCERFIASPPCRSKQGGRELQAMQRIQTRGYACTKEVAMACGEPERKLYYAWYKLSRAGKLVHLGGSRFGAPMLEAAE